MIFLRIPWLYAFHTLSINGIILLSHWYNYTQYRTCRRSSISRMQTFMHCVKQNKTHVIRIIFSMHLSISIRLIYNVNFFYGPKLFPLSSLFFLYALSRDMNNIYIDNEYISLFLFFLFFFWVWNQEAKAHTEEKKNVFHIIVHYANALFHAGIFLLFFFYSQHE